MAHGQGSEIVGVIASVTISIAKRLKWLLYLFAKSPLMS